MQCEICGKETRVFLADVEGARLHVCSNCNPSGQGKVKFERPPQTERKPFVKRESRPFVKKDFAKKPFSGTSRPRPQFHRTPSFMKQADFELVDNYGEVLKKAREAKNLKLEDLAHKIREQFSFLHKIEQGKLKPNDRIIYKIYQELGVDLAKHDEEPSQETSEQKEEEKVEKFVEPFTEVTANKKRKLVW